MVARTHNPDECWLWKGRPNHFGYGVISVYFDGKLQDIIASRWAYYLTHGVYPGKLWVLHTCDNPPCCNPRHLYLGTPADNTADMMRRGRCPLGMARKHTKLTDDDVREIRRLCRTGEMTHRAIAEQFHIHQVTVSRIFKGEKRAAVTDRGVRLC